MARGMMERILRLMAEKKASDLYLSANAPAMLKINGLTSPINGQVLSADATLNLLSEFLPASGVEELLRTGELNTAVPIEGVGNFRLSAMRQRGSYAAVFRFVPTAIPSLESLNVAPVLADLVLEKRGLILMTGASGAGKSTTLAAMLDLRNRMIGGHILTVEDPIEYVFRNKKSVINQREVGLDTASLQVGLKNALRQAPDVIMIGEIRDRETMSSAIAYAQSGHLCMATLHANNSYQALNRILSFYPPEVRPTMLGDLAAALRSIVSQRLLRTHTGERLPSMEILLNTALIKDLIQKADFSGVREAMEKSTAVGSQSFEQDLARLVTEGKVSRSEAIAHADSANNLLWRLQNDFHNAATHTQLAITEEECDDEASFTDFTLDVKH